MARFNDFYEQNNMYIYSTNDSGCLKKFAETHKDLIGRLPKMSSLELINSIISSDSFLLKLEEIINWLRETKTIDDDEINAYLQQLSGQDLNFAYSGDHLEEPQWRMLYTLLIRVIKSKGIVAATEILNSLNLENCPLMQVLGGGLPFIDLRYYENNNGIMNGLKAIKRFKVLDFMRNSDLARIQETGSLGNNSSNSGKKGKARSIGNSNWLLWQRTLHQAIQHSGFLREKVLFGYLSSDLIFSTKNIQGDRVEEVTSEFDDKILELFRVRLRFYRQD